MKKITFRVEESLIEQGRAVARERRMTLNQMFREWLAGLSEPKEQNQRTADLMKKVD
ncbi:hypothetical protein [Phragmitibacter flavus]|uniref:hypothetical protein n=1 Tax=Phragmitibacter flavus TaxID=2576071 RepID=UPI00140C6D4A|nr:hypothetical protein [Phragmitibacter flavus]